VEFILMGCDGVWESKSNEQMITWVRSRLQKGSTPEQVVGELMREELAEEAEDEQGTDNMTAILITFHS
jgi:serine/threonine protein phosphatase PrpC